MVRAFGVSGHRAPEIIQVHATSLAGRAELDNLVGATAQRDVASRVAQPAEIEAERVGKDTDG
jgi:hypothetical protein